MNRQRIGYATKSLLRRAGLEVSRYRPRGEEQFPPLVDSDFPPIYRRNCHHTMVPWQGLYTAYKAARYVVHHRVPGDVVECGVWRGGCSVLMAEAMLQEGDRARDFYLYDTFAGMSEPTEADVNAAAGYTAREVYERNQRDGFNAWCYGPESEVRELIAQSDYPTDRFTLVRGKVEETIPETMPERIALLRLDTDWYESTRHELQHLFPRLSLGGVFITDDYGAWAGARRAIDEYFAETGHQILLHPDYASGAVAGVRVA